MLKSPTTVEAQPRQGLPYGLFTALALRPSDDPHWRQGIQWEYLTCDPVTGFEVEDGELCGNAATVDLTATGGSGSDSAEATSFTIQDFYKCGAPGSGGLSVGQEKATARLLAREEAAVEARLWRRLRADAEDLNPGGALDPVAALAALEDWMGTVYGSLGVLHATRGGATVLGAHVQGSGQRLLTRLGTPVVAGAGYPGTSPEGAAAADGETWLMASPALFGYKGPVSAGGARSLLDHRRNDLYALAQRDYVVAWDPCGVAAVRVNKTCC